MHVQCKRKVHQGYGICENHNIRAYRSCLLAQRRNTMNDDSKRSAVFKKLRSEAEKAVAENPADDATLRELDARRLLHELQVHQIELEMQHAELVHSRQTLDLLQDQFTTLYDFAPVGYMTLNRDGYVLKCNLAAAGLVGLTRSEIGKRLFSRLVAEADRPLFGSFLKQVFDDRPLETNCQLRLLKRGQADISVQVKAQTGRSDRECLLAIVAAVEGNHTLSPARVPISALSRRERETLRFVVEGKTNSAISELMNISPKSVETYRHRMMKKLGVSNIPDLVRFALLFGIISL